MKLASAAAGATLASRNMRAFSSQGSVSLAVVPPLSVFNYSQVELLDGLFRQQFDNNHNLYLHLDEDALLNHFVTAWACRRPVPTWAVGMTTQTISAHLTIFTLS